MMKSHLKLHRPYTSQSQKYRIIIKKDRDKEFKIHDRVANALGLKGKIIKIDNDQLIVKWNDNTFERIYIISANQLLNKINDSDNDYTEVIEMQVTPKNIPITSSKKDEKEQLVRAAISKGIIDADDYDIELAKIASFDKESFEQYRNQIENFKTDGNQVWSANSIQPEIDDGLSPKEREAHQMLNQLRQNGKVQVASNIDYSSSESRSLHDVDNNTTKDLISFEDSLFRNINVEDGHILNDGNNNLDVEECTNLPGSSLDLDMLIEQIGKDTTWSDSSNNNDINTNINNDINNESNIDENDDQKNKVAFLETPFYGLTKPILSGVNDNRNISQFDDLSKMDWTTMSRRVGRL